MNEKVVISIPDKLFHPFFFSDDKEIIVDEELFMNFSPFIPLIYEAAYYSDIDAIKPWEMQEECIPMVIKEWKEVKIILKKLFEKREQIIAVVPMKKAIALFIELLYWTNGLPVDFTGELNMESIKIHPVNIKERLDFIFKRPSLYHAFIQLSELFAETEKLYFKHIALKKASKR